MLVCKIPGKCVFYESLFSYQGYNYLLLIVLSLSFPLLSSPHLTLPPSLLSSSLSLFSLLPFFLLPLPSLPPPKNRFRSAGNGNANARILNFVLQRNKWIKELDLSNTGLDDDGIKEIADGLKENSSIEKVNLARNHFGVAGANYLTSALQMNNTIKDMDLSANALGYHSINSLLCICGPKNVRLNTEGNYVFEEILNSVSHGVAFLGSVVGANILISDATDAYHTERVFWAAVIYSSALMFLFLSSCLFHSFFMLPTSKPVLPFSSSRLFSSLL